MIQLTQKGKEIYGEFKLKVDIEGEWCVLRLNNSTLYKGTQIASNPLELKALLDMGLIEIK